MKFSTKVSNNLIITICCTILFLSCSNESEKTLSRDEFSAILGELVIIERMNISDTLKIVLVKKQLENNKVSVDDIQNQIERKKNDSTYWLNIFERADTRLKELKKTN